MDRSTRDRKPTSWTARILAPLLLIVAVGAVVIIVSGSLGNDDDSDGSDRDNSTTASTSCKPSDPDAVKAGYYVVTAEDVGGFEGISAKTCVPVDKLIELNPSLDPQTLQVENCVDLVKDGCKALAGG
jgi:hypothetical protein